MDILHLMLSQVGLVHLSFQVFCVMFVVAVYSLAAFPLPSCLLFWSCLYPKFAGQEFAFA